MEPTNNSVPISQNLKRALTARPGLSDVTEETRRSLALYYGGYALRDIIETNSQIEDQVKYEWRRNAMVDEYENYPEEITQQYVESIKKAGKIERRLGKKTTTPANEYLEKRYREWFDVEFAATSLILPETFVQICIPDIADTEREKLITKADVAEANLTPYPVIIYPQFVRNFCVDDDGCIEWISIQCGQNKILLYDETNVYTIEMESGVGEHKAAADNIKEVRPHGFSDCPFVRVAWKENKSVQGEPKPGQAMMASVIRLSKGALTQKGRLIEAIKFSLFPEFATDEKTFKNIQEQGRGAATVLVEGTDMTGKPTMASRYIEKSNSEIEALERICYERFPKVIYRVARLRDRSTDKVQSGISKLMDMVPEVAVLSEIADFWQKADARILYFIGAGFGEETDPALIYPKTFNVKSTAEILQETTDFTVTMDRSSLPQSKTANERMAMRLYRQMLPDLDEKEYKTIEDEIKAYEPPAPPPLPPEMLPKPNGGIPIPKLKTAE